MKISEFYNNDLVDYASYSTLRMIGSCIDGLKNSQRKAVFTVIEKNINKEIKVSQLASKVAEFAEYLHGDVSLQGVIVNLAQDFTGSNNLNLLVPEGNFGTRFTPEASASRYIYTYGSENLWNLFNKDDNPILIHQNFEGHDIEPRFYVPSLPLILINGSEGIASGFAQKILPRDPEDIKEQLYQHLKNNSPILVPPPRYKGFSGTIMRDHENPKKWEIYGVFEFKNNTTVIIKEVPIGYSLKGYLKVLDKLEDDGVIQSYVDKSEDDNFHFEVKFKAADLKKYDVDKLAEKLKLVKTVTENYTCIDENNRVKVFESPEEILEHYVEIRLQYLSKRKDYLIQKISEEIRYDVSKYIFVKSIIDGELIVNNRPKKDIIKDLENIDKIIKQDENFDYLLNMRIYSLTKEKLKELYDKIKNKKKELDEIRSLSEKEMWLKEI